MTNLQKGLALAGAQLALVASLAAKYAVDRARLPRVWVQTMAYDPDMPIRGRYVSLRLRVDASGLESGSEPPAQLRMANWRDVTLGVQQGHLAAYPADRPTGLHVTHWRTRTGEEVTVLSEPVDFFLPEHARDPSRRNQGEELWIEVTVPKKGPPRPIRLAIKSGETFTPLEIR